MIRCKDCKWWRKRQDCSFTGSCDRCFVFEMPPMFYLEADEDHKLWTSGDFGCIAAEPKEQDAGHHD